MRLLMITFLLAALVAARVVAQNADGDGAPGGVDVAAEKSRASEDASQEFARLVCRGVDAADAPAVPVPDSLLNWSNPDAGRVYGDVYLWTKGGRPVAVVSVFRWYQPYRSLNVELSSMSEAPVVVERNGEAFWQPTQGGITWQPLTGDVQPRPSRAFRLVQMKQIARRFSAELADGRSGRASDKVLRLLPQPVYRYPDEGANAPDGAVFTMVVGTDPELLLLVESNSDGWRYAVARMNRDAIDVTCDGRRVASFARLADSELYDARQPYCLVSPISHGVALA
jgi:hypothetical protein